MVICAEHGASADSLLSRPQPGCSSIGELMSSNGPFLWPTGVFKPIKNQWSYVRPCAHLAAGIDVSSKVIRHADK